MKSSQGGVVSAVLKKLQLAESKGTRGSNVPNERTVRGDATCDEDSQKPSLQTASENLSSTSNSLLEVDFSACLFALCSITVSLFAGYLLKRKFQK